MDTFNLFNLEDSKNEIFFLNDSFSERLLVIVGNEDQILAFRRGLKYLQTDILCSIKAVKQYVFLDSVGFAILVDLEYTLIKLYKWIVMLIQANSFNLSVDFIFRLSSKVGTNKMVKKGDTPLDVQHNSSVKKDQKSLKKPKVKASSPKKKQHSQRFNDLFNINFKKYSFTDLYGYFKSFSQSIGCLYNPYDFLKAKEKSEIKQKTFLDEVVRVQPLFELHNHCSGNIGSSAERVRALSFQNNGKRLMDLKESPDNLDTKFTEKNSVVISEAELNFISECI